MFDRLLTHSTGLDEYVVPEYVPGTHTLWVFINGKKEYVEDDYIETSSTSIKFIKTVPRGALIELLIWKDGVT